MVTKKIIGDINKRDGLWSDIWVYCWTRKCETDVSATWCSESGDESKDRRYDVSFPPKQQLHHSCTTQVCTTGGYLPRKNFCQRTEKRPGWLALYILLVLFLYCAGLWWRRQQEKGHSEKGTELNSDKNEIRNVNCLTLLQDSRYLLGNRYLIPLGT